MTEDINTQDQKQAEPQNPLPQNSPERPPGADSYGQYIDPDYHKKQKKKKQLLIVGVVAGALVLIIVAIVIALSLSSEKNTAENPANTSGDEAAITKNCEDEQCFEEQFSLCLPATYRETAGNNVIDYKITGVKEVGCLASFKYVSSDVTEVAGKDMTCDFDDQLDFQSATQLAFDYPADYECEGSLADYLLSADNL